MKFAHQHYFVTGTDTGIGKTFVTRQIMRALKAQGQSVLGLKPIACGTDQDQHEDAANYLQENSLPLPYQSVNPFLFKAPISPHLAAAAENQVITVQEVVKEIQPLLTQPVDHIFIEGAGGICVPLNENETLLDLMKALNLPIILVVGMRLGCLNHALLSAQAIESAGLKLAGWVANPIDPDMIYRSENIETLEKKLGKKINIDLTQIIE